MENDHKLTKKEKKELRKMEWSEKAKLNERNAQFKKYSIWGAAIIVVVAVVGGLIWLVNYSPSSTTGTSVTVAPISSKDMVRGNKNAKAKLIEYGDFQCPACGAYYPLVKQLLSDESTNNLYFVYRFFPLVNVHPNAFVADQAAYAAFKQGKFWEMYDLLYTNQNDWANLPDPTQAFNDYAKKLNLNMTKFLADYSSSDTKKYVQESEDRGTSEGINQTPTFILNGTQITNPQNYADFKKLVDNEINKK